MSTDTTTPASQSAGLSRETVHLEDGDATEYRGVSVLMADLVASTDHMETLGPEGYAALLRRFHTICNDAVRARGGMVAQYQGDGIICYFGFPRAGEDDAVRAVQSALDILDVIAASDDEGAIRTRIGISSGTVMLRADGDQFGANAVGSSINKAARLEALAEANTVLICEDTLRLVGGLFQTRDLGPQKLKGFRQAQNVFQATRGRSGVTTRFEALRGNQTTDLIGRDDELQQLRNLFEDSRNGAGQTAVIAAGPGLGKSRLVSAFLQDDALRGAPCFLLQCSPEQMSTPLHPVIRYLEWVAGTGSHEGDTARHAKLKRLVQNVWGADATETDILLDLLSPLGAEGPLDQSESPPLRRQRALTLLAEKIFASVSGRGAFMVVFEDVHWVDPTSELLLGILSSLIGQHRALMLMTTRQEPPYGDGMEGAVTLRLAPLSEADSQRLARETLGEAGISEAQIAKVIEKSDGVPLYLQEYAAMLRDGSAGLDGDIPLTLGGLVQTKLDRLEKPERRFAQAGAALGRVFDPELVVRVLGLEGSDMAGLTQALGDLRLTETLDTVVDGESQSFSHALVRDAIYSSMSGHRRKQIHDAIASVYLSMQDGFSVADHVLADHLGRAERYAEAAQHYLRAGMTAAGQGAAGEALRHLEAGLAVIATMPDGPERDMLELQLCAVLGPTQMVTRGPGNPDFGQTQARAMDLVDRLDLHAQMVPVIYNTALHAWAIADLDRAMTISDAIRMIDAQSPADGSYMGAHTMRGLISWHKGDNATAAEALSRTVERHDPMTHAPLYAAFLKEFGVFSLFYLGLTHTVQGDFAKGAQFAEDALNLGDQMGFPHERGFGLLARFNTAMLRGDVDTADMASRAALEFSTRQGFPEFMAMSGFVQGWCAAERGDAEQGVAQMEEGLAFWAATGFTCWQSLFAAILAPRMLDVGRIEDAAELAERYLTLIDQTGEHQTRAPLLLARAKIARARGLTEAADIAEQARQVARGQGAGLWLSWIDGAFPN